MKSFESHGAVLEGLQAFLRIPSISTLPEHRADIRRAAEFVHDLFHRAGLENCELIEGDGHPLVYGDWCKAPGRPTVLLYGHYDVQPADPIEEWHSPPFEPVVRGSNIFARGASDDKAQTYLLIKAVETVMRSRARFPINIKVLIEGEEETGGKHLEKYVSTNPGRIQADVAVICDTEMFAPGVPTVCLGLRGTICAEIVVTGAGHDLHSGIYGGVAPNPLHAMAEILTALKDQDGHIRIPGFYDKVLPPAAWESEAWAQLPFDEAEYLQRIGATELVGEPNVPVFERLWVRPTFEVHGICGGFTGEGSKTVIPATAVAKISVRLVVGQSPLEVAGQLETAIQQATPKGVRSKLRLLYADEPYSIEPGNRFILTAAASLRSVFGKDVVSVRSGVSIPVAGLLKRCGTPSVLIGFGLPDDNTHAPNEKFHLPNLFLGIEAMTDYFDRLGGAPNLSETPVVGI